MGRVEDPAEAKNTGCTCYQTDKVPEPDPNKYPDAFMCFSRGVIGTLSNSQDRAFCTEEDMRIIPRELTQMTELGQHQEKFEIMGQIMDECMEEEYETPRDFLSCTIEKAKGLKDRY